MHLGFSSTTHKPCLYSGKIDNETVFLLRQVDDFAVSASHRDICDKVFASIQTKLTQPLKLLGVLTMYNGLDIAQHDKYIKISCQTYLHKILQGHGWLSDSSNPVKTPMQGNSTYLKDLSDAVGPTDDTAKRDLQQAMGFSF